MVRHAKFLSIALTLTLAATITIATSANAARPNVVVIMTDDQGYGDLSCHGNPLLKTPSIDRLAAGSVRLTDFHVAPMCTPTRGQFLTGLDALSNGAMNVSSGRTLLRPELKTIADVFRSAGYRTGIFGKWHLGDNYPFRPIDRGFDEAIWFPSSHVNSVPDFWDNDYFDDTYLHGERREPFPGYCTDVFFGQAMKWIESSDDKPFFAFIPLNAAHWPHFVPDSYRSPIRAAMEDNPEVVQHLEPNRRTALVSFLAMIANIDDNVGRLDRFLKASERFDNTIVVFMTDNGSTMGARYFNAGMRGTKTQLWEGGHRVPCFIRWPDGKLATRDLDGLSHVQDMLPTLAELAGIDEIPASLDGDSLADALRDPAQQIPDRTLVINYSRMPVFKATYTTTPEVPAREGAAVMWQRWRLIEDRELYDLEQDPMQQRDVAAEHPEVVARLRAHLDKWWAGVKEKVMEPQRVVIGNDAENPMLLTACEWLDIFVDQQLQIRLGTRKNGIWHLHVDQPGSYSFELRRWPRESGLALDETVSGTKVTDGDYVAGKVLPIASARIRIGEHEAALAKDEDGQSLTFTTDLEAGPIEFQTWMLDAAGEEICGAYYVHVARLD